MAQVTFTFCKSFALHFFISNVIHFRSIFGSGGKFVAVDQVHMFAARYLPEAWGVSALPFCEMSAYCDSLVNPTLPAL